MMMMEVATERYEGGRVEDLAGHGHAAGHVMDVLVDLLLQSPVLLFMTNEKLYLSILYC